MSEPFQSPLTVPSSIAQFAWANPFKPKIPFLLTCLFVEGAGGPNANTEEWKELEVCDHDSLRMPGH